MTRSDRHEALSTAVPDHPRGSTRVSSRGQVVIPKPVRERLNLQPGTELEVWTDGPRVVFERREPAGWRRLRGSAAGEDLLGALAGEREQERSRDEALG